MKLETKVSITISEFKLMGLIKYKHVDLCTRHAVPYDIRLKENAKYVLYNA